MYVYMGFELADMLDTHEYIWGWQGLSHIKSEEYMLYVGKSLRGFAQFLR
jgi:hypothetical protein